MSTSFNLNSFKNFFSSTSTSGIILFACLLLSLIIANTSFGPGFDNLLATQIGFETESIHLRYSLALWINDGLMAIFFLLVGLEIKREVVEGELSSPKKAILPIICAIGGAIVPALIYTFFNGGKPTMHGWGIPMATDIAFALAILALLSDKVPVSLKIFLAALAIVDDLLAILVIAIFYSSELHYMNLVYAAAILGLLFLFNRFGIKNLAFYLIPGVFIWYFVHHSGIHATIAGVLTALTLPTTADDTESPLEKLEHALTVPVNFLIIPIFALANTNIRFEEGMVEGLFTGLGMGIVLGLVVGKPIGIMLIAWLGVKLKISELPEQSRWIHMLGLGLLGGIGFTMSIFISILSFSDPMLVQEAKFSILVGSVLSGFLGYMVLSFSSKSKQVLR
ncbi:Na+/H+ antiporter NhaA [Pedobacter sp. SAFR-022]|uniref:Na+/H+ antiporter NhaA n=1 Tax=Pedobacter sp. SAFR-022 TaxID=3436861 RepID=UPI003F8168D0